jgi:hypothetical protein
MLTVPRPVSMVRSGSHHACLSRMTNPPSPVLAQSPPVLTASGGLQPRSYSLPQVPYRTRTPGESPPDSSTRSIGRPAYSCPTQKTCRHWCVPSAVASTSSYRTFSGVGMISCGASWKVLPPTQPANTEKAKRPTTMDPACLQSCARRKSVILPTVVDQWRM